MQRIIIAIVLLIALGSGLYAASNSLSNLTAGGAVSGTDLFYDVQTAGTGGVKVTGTQLKTFMLATPTLTGTTTAATATFSGNITGSAGAQLLGALTGTTAVFQTVTVNNLTPTGPNCLQETGGVIQATNSTCGGGGGGSPGGATTNVQFNNAASFGGDAGFTYAGSQGVVSIVPTNSNALSIGMGTLTTNTKAINISATWNSSGVAFDAPIFMTITRTAAALASTYFDIQENGSSVFNVGVDTSANPGTVTGYRFLATGSGSYAFISNNSNGNAFRADVAGTAIVTNQVAMSKGPALTWTGTANWFDTTDTSLYRDGSQATLAVSDGTTTSARFAVYNTTDQAGGGVAPLTYERGVIDWKTSPSTLTIGTQQGGAGVGRVVMLVASGTKAISLSPTINIYGQSNPSANETYAVCAGSGATSLTAGGQLFVDTTACLASSMLVKHDIAAFNDYGMTKLASLAAPLHAEHRLQSAPIDIDPIAEAMALVPAVATYDTLSSNGPEFTLIAQQVCQIDERLCERTRTGEVRSFKPNSVISILVAAFQKQQAEIDELKRRLH